MWEEEMAVRTFQSGEEKAWGDLINGYKYPMGGNEEERARLFSVVPTDRTTGHKLKARKLNLNTQKHSFFSPPLYCDGDQTLEQVAQRGCEVSSVEHSDPDWTWSWAADLA